MASDVEICNMALRHIGLPTISSLVSPSTQAARDCALFFNPTRDAVLRDHPWNFAQKSRALAAFAMPDGYDARFGYAYVYPTDALMMHKVYRIGSTTALDFEIKRAPTNEKIILVNAEGALADYTMRVTDPTWFDAEFVEALSFAIASKLARSLTQNDQVEQSMLVKYQNFIAQAKTTDSREGNPDPVETVPWIDARTSYPGTTSYVGWVR